MIGRKRIALLLAALPLPASATVFQSFHFAGNPGLVRFSGGTVEDLFVSYVTLYAFIDAYELDGVIYEDGDSYDLSGGCAANAPCVDPFLSRVRATASAVSFAYDQPESYDHCAVHLGLCAEFWFRPDFFIDGSFSAPVTVTTIAGAAVPEAASWAMMIAGFGLSGAALRRQAVRARVTS